MILSKLQLVENIVTELSDNSTGQISPYDIRHNLLDIIDSVHLLTGDQNLNAKNLSTPATRTTRAGEFAITNLNLNGYFIVDNSAFGYESLKSNYQGSKNTAIGSKSLSCNVYGDNNAGLGYLSLSSNSTGHGNVGIGNFSLSNNRVGNFNIAIGHGAGFYADRNTNSKLFIASHPIDDDYLCDNPLGSGLIPLVYGDLTAIKFGIGVRELHDNSTLQVAGNITPSISDSYDLGNTEFYWKNLFLSDSLLHSSGNVSISLAADDIFISGNVNPNNNLQNFGNISQPWHSGVFRNLVVTGRAQISVLNAVETCFFPCKTLFLASSGCDSNFNLCNYLSDEELVGAGFNIVSSNNRTYTLDFAPPSSGISFDNNPFAKASWNTNASFRIDKNSYLVSDKVVSHKNDGYGLYFQNNIAYFSNHNTYKANPSIASGNLAGIGNFNFISNSGQSENYFSSIISVESGVNVGLRLITGAKRIEKDTNNLNKNKLRGFEFKYVDDSLAGVIGAKSDRLVIGSYDNTSYNQNALTLMQNNGEGIVSINNLAQLSENIIPKTSLDIRSTGNAIIRSTAENQSRTMAALQLMGQESCLYRGAEFAYLNTSGVADISMYRDSGRSTFLRFYENRTIGVFTSSGVSNEMLTMGDVFNNKPVISMYHASGTVSSSVNYGKIFTRPKIRTSQSSSLYLLDSSGNLHDIVLNSLDHLDGRALYVDNSFNTFGGLHSPRTRVNLNSNTRNNTALGYAAYNNGTSGGYENVIIGSHAGSGISTGYQNTILGHRSGSSFSTGNNNIVIGNNNFNSTNASINNNIVIGNSGLANNTTSNYQFWLGANRNLVLLQGTLGPNNNDKILTMPSGGKLLLFNNNHSEGTEFRTNTIDVKDYGGSDYPENSLSFRFSGNKSSTLMVLNHDAEPITQSPIYTQPSPARPFAEIRGDLRVLGDIRFKDNTSMGSYQEVINNSNNINVLSSGVDAINNALASLIVEGYCPLKIPAPSGSSFPQTGSLIIKNSNWEDVSSVTLVNRDINLNIPQGAYIIAVKVNTEYRPLWISAQNECHVCCN